MNSLADSPIICVRKSLSVAVCSRSTLFQTFSELKAAKTFDMIGACSILKRLRMESVAVCRAVQCTDLHRHSGVLKPGGGSSVHYVERKYFCVAVVFVTRTRRALFIKC